ncbi:mitotic checkpoint serine/threonine-protein kinase BUB1 beta [Protopterus annectens]|uniref:mitotic checkpoint serine/threonine-protein kinase BUB1 beta n=1 Tax=Protopterus annectens TaxID=7888 RepID=UPI001CF940E7|nr:mitotic checkpoint serine/threonine-protein kinase BUB1 beta [Protopterus annectens]
MSTEDNEWELSKENVQPLRRGRAVSTLQEVLATQEGPSHTAVQQQKLAFESEIRFYKGADPLDVWDRYIKWTEEAYPQGGKESNLTALLERVVQRFGEETKYYNDPRLLDIWLKFANICTEPLDVYRYLHGQGIGVNVASLYIAWAEAYEAAGNYKQGDAVFQEGIKQKAEPLDKLEAQHRQFQTRVSRQAFLGIMEGADDDDLSSVAAEPQRATLKELKFKGKKIALAPVNRVGDTVKARSRGLTLNLPPPRQLQQSGNFSVFDENSASDCNSAINEIASQTWGGLPCVKQKENELKAGPWNMPVHSRNRSANVESSCSKPNFIPYVEESAQYQAVTPCKIDPSVNNILHTRKPGKEADPLERVQLCQQVQEKTERTMYIKEMLYAGVEEFCFEEIRAEIYREKQKKRNKEEIAAIMQKNAEMERQIQEMKKKLELAEKNPETEQASVPCVSQETYLPQVSLSPASVSSRAIETGEKIALSIDTPLSLKKPAADYQSVSCSTLSREPGEIGKENLMSVQSCTATDFQLHADAPPPTTTPPLLSSFTIFDESTFLKSQETKPVGNQLPESARRPLTVIPKPLSFILQDVKSVEQSDEVNGMESLQEDVIVSGSCNKTLCTNLEDTSDFARAAQLASTPFRSEMNSDFKLPNKKEDGQSENSTMSEQKDSYFSQALHINKLSPILEASEEDVRSLSSGSSVIDIKELHIHGHLDLGHSAVALSATSTHCVEDNPWSAEVRRKIMSSLTEPLNSLLDVHMNCGVLPELVKGHEVTLGSGKYLVVNEAMKTENCILFFATSVHSVPKEVVIKVNFQPIPWDLYIIQQLRTRLSSETEFGKDYTMYMYENGCIALLHDIHHLTLKDIISSSDITPEWTQVLSMKLISLVAELHKAEIVHGDLRPEMLLLGHRNLKLVDFSYSLDLKQQNDVTLLDGFPTVTRLEEQEFLKECTSPYQVDLLSIVDIVHTLMFEESLQIHKEDSVWKLSNQIPKNFDEDLWGCFFESLLNPGIESTVSLLDDLVQKMSILDYVDVECTLFEQFMSLSC